MGFIIYQKNNNGEAVSSRGMTSPTAFPQHPTAMSVTSAMSSSLLEYEEMVAETTKKDLDAPGMQPCSPVLGRLHLPGSHCAWPSK